ncbi:MAG: HIT domain-containing protein [Rhizobiales bacterium]|nr:HIT domain-containing protein [Hyphomicrobiales bacterium]
MLSTSIASERVGGDARLREIDGDHFDIEIFDPIVKRLMNDANYPWLVLVPRRAGASEIIDLAEADRAQLMTEIVRTGHALKTVTQCDKLNIAAIGNMVPQLHVHIVARRLGDAAWPRPVWGAVPPLAYEHTAFAAFVAAVRREMRVG